MPSRRECSHRLQKSVLCVRGLRKIALTCFCHPFALTVWASQQTSRVNVMGGVYRRGGRRRKALLCVMGIMAAL